MIQCSSLDAPAILTWGQFPKLIRFPSKCFWRSKALLIFIIIMRPQTKWDPCTVGRQRSKRVSINSFFLKDRLYYWRLWISSTVGLQIICAAKSAYCQSRRYVNSKCLWPYGSSYHESPIIQYLIHFNVLFLYLQCNSFVGYLKFERRLIITILFVRDRLKANSRLNCLLCTIEQAGPGK